MDAGATFVTAFSTLDGIHFNERKKNFYKLLYSTDRTIVFQSIDLLSSAQKGFLEEIFYVDILIYAKHVDKLFEILKEGNGLLTSKILKQKWFFEQAFGTMNEIELVNEFLPSVSYSLRMKIIKKLALTLSESKMDLIFDLLFQRYSLFIAKQILFSCSSEKILTVLHNNVVNLSVEQLKRLLQKNSQLVKVYFDVYERNHGVAYSDRDFLSYLTWKYPDLYFEFVPYLKDTKKIGRQTTKTILKINSEQILKNTNTLSKRFNMGSISRKVPLFDEKYLCKMFPSDITKLANFYAWSELYYVLKKYPHKLRWLVFSKAFRRAYDKDVINHLENLHNDIVAILPLDIKCQWAELKYTNTQDRSFIKFMPFQKAFVLAKEIINVSSDSNLRKSLLDCLIFSCYNRKDYKSYEEVVKYIFDKHRNENSYTRQKLLTTISRSLDPELETEGLWRQINKLIDYSRVKSEPIHSELLAKYIVYLFKKKKPIQETVTFFVNGDLKQVCHQWKYEILSCFKGKPEDKRELILQIAECVSKFEESVRENEITSLFQILVDFSLEYKEIWIDLEDCPFLLEAIKSCITRKEEFSATDITKVKYFIMYNYSNESQKTLKICQDDQLLKVIKTICSKNETGWSILSGCFLKIIKKPRTTEFQEKLLHHIITDFLPTFDTNRSRGFGGHFTRQVADYLLKEEPALLAKYFDDFLALEQQNNILNYSCLRYYSHLGLDRAFEEKFRSLILTSKDRVSKNRFIGSLSEVMSNVNFINWLETEGYIPQTFKLDLEDEEQKQIYETQVLIIQKLKNFREARKLLPLLPSFCQGDYLQTSLPLMYHTLYNVNEVDALKCINFLAEKAVSAKKHSVFLSFELQSQNEALTLFQSLANKETNVSAKRSLFRALFKYFFKNSDKHILTLIITHMKFIDKNDKQIFALIIDSIEKVPNQLKPIFVEHFWGFIESMEREGFKGNDDKDNMLKKINNFDIVVFLELTNDFCHKVIKRYFFPNKDLLFISDQTYNFVSKYLLSRNDDESFNFVFNLLNSFKKSQGEANIKPTFEFLFTFFENIYSTALKSDLNFLKRLKQNWEQLLTLTESFTELVLLQLLLYHKETTSVEDFCKEVNKSYEELVRTYGPYINHLLFKSLNSFSGRLDPQSGKELYVYNPYRMAWNLLNAAENELNYYVAFHLLFQNSYCEDKEAYTEVANILKSANSLSANVYWNELLKPVF